MGSSVTEFSIKQTLLTMTGAEDSFVVPDDVASVGIQATVGTVNFRGTEAGGVDWPIQQGSKEFFDMRSISGRTLYFQGTAANAAVIRVIRGTLS